MKKIFVKVECYSNYLLICFKSKAITRFYELYENHDLDMKAVSSIMKTYTTIGFHSNTYDLLLIAYALKGANNSQLKSLSDDITSNMPNKELMDKYGIAIPKLWNHIDLTGPSGATSLRARTDDDMKILLQLYGARIHTTTLQNSPFDSNAIIDKSDHINLQSYCESETSIIIELYNAIENKITLREIISEEYELDLRSKSNAQIAEAVIKKSLLTHPKLNDVSLDHTYKYQVPDRIRFKTDQTTEFLNALKDHNFKCDEEGKLIKDPDLMNNIRICDVNFSVGLGGVHSNERHMSIHANKEEFILDIDVSSYYPTIILNNQYYPTHLGKDFIKIYKFFYTQRLVAKKNQDKIKSDIYKIILNSGFGKFGSKYSTLYSPSLLLHTTLTGQLSLLMLIEEILLNNFQIVSANTDGVTIKGDRSRLPILEVILQYWQLVSGFTLDKTFYKSIYYESVNSYLAVTINDEIKGKGTYSPAGINKNPSAQICVDAIIEALKNGKSITSHILENKDHITKFLLTRYISEGVTYKGDYLGKVVRWYYGLDGNIITGKDSGNKIAGSDGAIPLMTLPNISLKNIDFNKYIERTYMMLNNLGVSY